MESLIDTLIYYIVGAVFIVAGVIVIIKGKILEKKCTLSVSGRISEVINKGSSRFPILYPIFEFEAEDGTKVKEKCGYTTRKASDCRIGQSLMLMYNPENPEEFFVRDEHRYLLTGAVLLIFGIAALIPGGYGSLF